MCNYKATEIVLGLVILVFALWQITYSKWIIVIASVLLVLHGLMCRNLSSGMPMKTKKPVAKKKVAKKKAKKRKR